MVRFAPTFILRKLMLITDGLRPKDPKHIYANPYNPATVYDQSVVHFQLCLTLLQSYRSALRDFYMTCSVPFPPEMAESLHQFFGGLKKETAMQRQAVSTPLIRIPSFNTFLLIRATEMSPKGKKICRSVHMSKREGTFWKQETSLLPHTTLFAGT